MTLDEGRALAKMFRLSEVVYSGPANPGAATVLFRGSLLEGEQSVAAKAVAGQAGESELLARSNGG
jgi:hypothetical protein